MYFDQQPTVQHWTGETDPNKAETIRSNSTVLNSGNCAYGRRYSYYLLFIINARQLTVPVSVNLR